MTKQSDPEELLRQLLGHTMPMQSDQRIVERPPAPSISKASAEMLFAKMEEARAAGPQPSRRASMPVPKMGKPDTP